MILKEDNGNTKILLHNDIIKLIPHRYPFLLIDKITNIIIGKSVTGVKSVTFNESFFQGHFPNYPIMPGVLILEAMAQTAACLVSFSDKSLSKNNLVFFTGIEKAKFRKPVSPGCTINLNVKVVANKRTFYKFTAEALVDNTIMATSDFSAMLVDQEKAL